MYKTLLHAVLNHPKTAIALGALIQLIALICLPFPPRIYFDLSSISPESHEITATNNLSDRLFGPSDYIVVGVTSTSGSIFEPAAIDYVRHIERTLEALTGVKKEDITSIVSDRAEVVERVGDDVRITPIVGKGYSSEQLASRLRGSRIFRPLVSTDNRSTLILFRIHNPIEGKQIFVATLRDKLDAIATNGFTVTLGGQPVAFAEIERFSQHIFLVLPLALVIIGLIHFEAFRSMQGLVFPLITAVASATIGLAIMTRAGMRLDAFNSAATILIVALTAGHAVQMLKRYCEALDSRRVDGRLAGDRRALSRAAIEESFSTLAPIMTAASCVAALSFASLAIFKIPAIRGFGLFISVGVFAGLAIELTFIPALRLLVSPPALPMDRKVTAWDRLIGRLSRSANPRNAPYILFGWLAAFSICGILASQVEVNNSLDDNLATFTEFRKSERTLNTDFSGANVIYVLFQGSAPDSMTTGEMGMLMRDVQAYLSTVPDIGADASYFDAVQEVGCGFNDDYCKATAGYSSEAVRNFLATYEIGATPGALDDLLTSTKSAALIRVLARTDSSNFVSTLFSELNRRFGTRLPHGVRMMLGGTGATTLSVIES
ncbi:MAG: MMPL family transporter, partial [Kiritimatiellae bacterium]|nr:MMPL family transporter [Kiritimatiellia bacterium]